jgi:hypothetical protein
MILFYPNDNNQGGNMPINFMTGRGPSAKNQTSRNHTLDTNQKARQPTSRQVIKAEGLDMQENDHIDMSAANID